MEKEIIKQLLHRYFEGTTTEDEEAILKSYFESDKVVEEFEKYTGFFNGISELSAVQQDNPEDEIMDYILEHEAKEKTSYRRFYISITGIAACLVIIMGGILLRQQQQTFKDTFDNPDAAYTYATETLAYVAEKYNSGIEELSHFEKLYDAVNPLNQGLKPVNDFFDKK
jgi:uncharacterized membrane protein YcjF (UPF0283 family)